MTYLTISLWQLALAGLLLLVSIGLSLVLRLELEGRLFYAACRMVAQLLLIGLVLDWIFKLRNPWIILGMMLLMALVAAVTAVNRTDRRFPSIYWNSIVSILAATFIVTGITISGILPVRPWYDPQYLIPFVGMLLGNALTGIALALDRFMENLVRKRPQVEALLSLGAGRWEAAHGEIADALKTGMVPALNSMLVMGLVHLPGMMTGQILAGADPTDAVRYQILIMLMITATTALASFSMVLMAYRILFSPAPRLRLDRLTRVEKKRR